MASILPVVMKTQNKLVLNPAKYSLVTFSSDEYVAIQPPKFTSADT